MNRDSTRAYSDEHEKSVTKALGGWQQPQSGGGHWRKGDVVVKDASLLVECKCSMKSKDSFSIKKSWIDKNIEERWTQRLDHSAICFNFEPNGQNYYVINEALMRFLVDSIKNLDNIE